NAPSPCTKPPSPSANRSSAPPTPTPWPAATTSLVLAEPTKSDSRELQQAHRPQLPRSSCLAAAVLDRLPIPGPAMAAQPSSGGKGRGREFHHPRRRPEVSCAFE